MGFTVGVEVFKGAEFSGVAAVHFGTAGVVFDPIAFCEGLDFFDPFFSKFGGSVLEFTAKGPSDYVWVVGVLANDAVELDVGFGVKIAVGEPEGKFDPGLHSILVEEFEVVVRGEPEAEFDGIEAERSGVFDLFFDHVSVRVAVTEFGVPAPVEDASHHFFERRFWFNGFLLESFAEFDGAKDAAEGLVDVGDESAQGFFDGKFLAAVFSDADLDGYSFAFEGFEVDFECVPNAFMGGNVVTVDVDFGEVGDAVKDQFGVSIGDIDEGGVGCGSFPADIDVLSPCVGDSYFLESSVAIVYGPSCDLLIHSLQIRILFRGSVWVVNKKIETRMSLDSFHVIWLISDQRRLLQRRQRL